MAKAAELQITEKQEISCNPGTIDQDGICIVNPKLDPIATPASGYDDELVYTVILSVGIIGSIAGGVVFGKRKKIL